MTHVVLVLSFLDTAALFGEVIEYMIDQQVPYGFLSTYEETIFLRHIQIGGEWTLEYSPIVATGDNSTAEETR